MTVIRLYSSEEEYSKRLQPNIKPTVTLVKPKAEIRLRDYQQAAYDAVHRDFADGIRSVLLVLATGLGKTILFSKLIESWRGRVLVLVHLEELLQNAHQEIEAITGETVGIERQKDYAEGERVVVALLHSLVHRLERFPKDYFSLIIVDEAHHATSEGYLSVFRRFEHAKVVGLTATDGRADGKPLPFEKCSFRMGIKEGVEGGYLVPIRGKRIVIDSINLSKVKTKANGEFDDEALDDEMVKGAAAIADVITSDYPFDKGILFFPGCASARLTCEFINKKLEGLSIYIDGRITGTARRDLVRRLRDGDSNWLCNVGIATEGFNWPEASVVGMCTPTLSRAAYVQRAGRGTRPLQGLLSGYGTALERAVAIANSAKPYMTILDFTGISANQNLISHDSFLKEPEPVEPKEKRKRDIHSPEESTEILGDAPQGKAPRVNLFGSDFVQRITSSTEHSSEEYNPFEFSEGLPDAGPRLKSPLVQDGEISEKQYKLICKFGIDDKLLTKKQAQKLIGFAAQRNFRLTLADRGILKALYKSLKEEK